MCPRTSVLVPHSQVPAEGLQPIEADGRRLVLCAVDGRLHALDDRCSHQGYPLSSVGCLVDGRLVCGLHGSTFDPATGESCRPPATRAVPVHQTESGGDGLRIHLDQPGRR